MGKFILVDGKISSKTLEKKYGQKELRPEDTVYVFPGNLGHQNKLLDGYWEGDDVTLFSVKKGDGLAKIAKEQGELGRATVSLPTTGVKSEKGKIPVIAIFAIADLWRAVGYGKSIVLPVRPKGKKNRYFDNHLNSAKLDKVALDFSDEDEKDFEPAFWGGVNKKVDKKLANYYLKNLLLLRAYSYLDQLGAEGLDRKEALFRGLFQLFQDSFEKGVAEKEKPQDQQSKWFRPQVVSQIEENIDDTVSDGLQGDDEVLGGHYGGLDMDGSDSNQADAVDNTSYAAVETETEDGLGQGQEKEEITPCLDPVGKHHDATDQVAGDQTVWSSFGVGVDEKSCNRRFYIRSAASLIFGCGIVTAPMMLAAYVSSKVERLIAKQIEGLILLSAGPMDGLVDDDQSDDRSMYADEETEEKVADENKDENKDKDKDEVVEEHTKANEDKEEEEEEKEKEKEKEEEEEEEDDDNDDMVHVHDGLSVFEQPSQTSNAIPNCCRSSSATVKKGPSHFFVQLDEQSCNSRFKKRCIASMIFCFGVFAAPLMLGAYVKTEAEIAFGKWIESHEGDQHQPLTEDGAPGYGSGRSAPGLIDV